MKSILYPALVLIVMPFSIASASTTIEYDGECKYFNANKVLKYSGKCHFNWGVSMESPNEQGHIKTYQRYIMTYSNKNDVWIYINEDGSATVNDIPAMSLKSKKGLEKVKTTQGEVFEFTEGSE